MAEIHLADSMLWGFLKVIRSWNTIMALLYLYDWARLLVSWPLQSEGCSSVIHMYSSNLVMLCRIWRQSPNSEFLPTSWFDVHNYGKHNIFIPEYGCFHEVHRWDCDWRFDHMGIRNMCGLHATMTLTNIDWNDVNSFVLEYGSTVARRMIAIYWRKAAEN